MRDCSGAARARASRHIGGLRPTLAFALTPILACGLMLAGCADDAQPTAAPTAAAAALTAAAPAPAAPPATVASVASADATAPGTVLPNDPSAPANTPLCGIAARERNDISRQLLPRRYAEAGQCASFACYDAATATYIGADGYRHVCR